jgi:hypothetical protein
VKTKNTVSAFLYHSLVVFLRLPQFFLRGTQLQQLSEEYELIAANINTTGTILTRKADDLPDLKEALDVAQREYDDGLKAQELRGRQARLRIELAWAHCNEKEKVSHFRLQACFPH